MRTAFYLIAAVLLAWGASIAGPFHFDDYNLLVDPLITSPGGWLSVWKPIQTRPLSQFTFWLTYALAGATPWAFHLWNIALHAAATMLVWRTLRLVIDDRAAVIAAAVFAVHPIQAEPVNYIFARSSELSTVLCLAVWWLWLRGRVWPAVAVFGLALLAKEECVTFPFFLALIDWWRGSKRQWKGIAAMLGLAFVLGMRVLIATKFVAASGGGFASQNTPLQYFTAQGIVMLRYLRLLIVPWGFTVDPEIHVAVPWLAWLALAALVMAACRFVRQASARGRLQPPPLAAASIWILAALILLIPSSSIFPADDLAADRRMYLPMIAFSAAIGVLAARFNPKILAVAGTILIALSLTRTSVWSTERDLWTEAVERAPDKVRPRIQLARSLDPNAGLDVLAEADRKFPDNFDIATERGRLLLSTGRAPEALSAFGRALALNPSSAMALNNRGVALATLGQTAAARADFERALKSDPCFDEAARNLQRLGFPVPVRASCPKPL